jgi:ectoine hydroxylase-related dioxygenase (phytanoyl-CoA dioxygenase family)
MTEVTTAITAEQREFWGQNGYLALERFCTDAEVEAIKDAYRKVWETCPPSIVVDNLVNGRRCRMSQLSDDEREVPFYKVNDLFLEFEEVRQVVLSQRVSSLLAELLDDAPVLCNTLNLLRSSQQDDHVDAIFMTPRTPHKLVATWMALEDAHPDAGQLRYYPGSHLIPLFEFSNGTHHVDRSQMDEWASYYKGEVERRGLEAKLFSAKKGDLFIWHGDLMHGGSKVNDDQRTRDSLVSHFYSLEDSRAQKLDLVPLNSGYWWRRDPQEVPGEGSRLRTAAKAVVPQSVQRVLRERLRS